MPNIPTRPMTTEEILLADIEVMRNPPMWVATDTGTVEMSLSTSDMELRPPDSSISYDVLQQRYVVTEIKDEEREMDMSKAAEIQTQLYITNIKEAYSNVSNYLADYFHGHTQSDTVKALFKSIIECETALSKKHRQTLSPMTVNGEQSHQIEKVYTAFHSTFMNINSEAREASPLNYEERYKGYVAACNAAITQLHVVIKAIHTGDSFTVTNKHTKQLLKGLNNTTTEFYKYWPMYYNPVTNTITETYPLAVLKAEKIVCVVSGRKVNKRDAIPVSDGTYIAYNEYHGREDIQEEYVYCEMGRYAEGEKILHRAVDCVPVFGSNNSYAHRDVYLPTAQLKCHYHKGRDRFYNFDINVQCNYILGKGWVDDVGLKAYQAAHVLKYHKGADFWSIEGGFNLFLYCDDVLNYYPDFKTMPYEDTVRGHANPALNTLFMGLELEVEMSRKATMSVREAAEATFNALKGHAITMSDGSLDDGFEIVSVPATLGYHYGMWETFLRGPIRRQIVSYMRNTCGIHIHMSKECFSSLSLGKFCTFINSKENAPFIEVIAQRKANKYNARPPTTVGKGKNRGVFIGEDGKRHGKYTSVNLTKPHTIEVRIFKGTLAYPQVMKNFEFLHALHKYVSFYSSNRSLSYKDFVKWLVEEPGNRKMYGFLYDYLTVTKYINTKHERVASVTKDDLTDSLAESGENGVEVLSRISNDKLNSIRRACAHKINRQVEGDVKCA